MAEAAEADSTYSVGDTWPPQRMHIEDNAGELVDISGAESTTVFIKGKTTSGGTLKISGTVEAIEPPEPKVDDPEEKPFWNVRTTFVEGDLSAPTSESTAKVKVVWEPGKVQFFPNKNTAPTFALTENNE